jgi:hypothetical protein
MNIWILAIIGIIAAAFIWYYFVPHKEIGLYGHSRYQLEQMRKRGEPIPVGM